VIRAEDAIDGRDGAGSRRRTAFRRRAARTGAGHDGGVAAPATWMLFTSPLTPLTWTSDEKRRRAAPQIAGAVNGVKDSVNNTPGGGRGTPPSSSGSGTSRRRRQRRPSRDRHRRAVRFRPPGTIHTERRPVLRATDRHGGLSADDGAGAQAAADHVLVRGATPATVRARVAHGAARTAWTRPGVTLVLTDGSVPRAPSRPRSVHRGTERLTLGQVEPGSRFA